MPEWERLRRKARKLRRLADVRRKEADAKRKVADAWRIKADAWSKISYNNIMEELGKRPSPSARYCGGPVPPSPAA